MNVWKIGLTLWFALFAAMVIYDFADFRAHMVDLGKQCAALAGQPYVGKSCRDIAREQTTKG